MLEFIDFFIFDFIFAISKHAQTRSQSLLVLKYKPSIISQL